MSSLDDFLGGADKPERIRTSIYINRDDFLALEQRALNAKRLKKGEKSVSAIIQKLISEHLQE